MKPITQLWQTSSFILWKAFSTPRHLIIGSSYFSILRILLYSPTLLSTIGYIFLVKLGIIDFIVLISVALGLVYMQHTLVGYTMVYMQDPVFSRFMPQSKLSFWSGPWLLVTKYVILRWTLIQTKTSELAFIFYSISSFMSSQGMYISATNAQVCSHSSVAVSFWWPWHV